MIVLNWNISYASRIQDIIAELKRNVGNHDFIITLQEVIPSSYDALAYAFDGIANVRYSLDYRRPGKFDNKSRQLGIMILTSNGITVEDAGVLQRTILPDRTLYVHVCANGKKTLIISLHSITGCDYVRAKALQFLSWAEAVDEMKPDIVTFDSNEPKTDSYDIAKMQFFDNTDMGKGAQTFFQTLSTCRLIDAYASKYDTTRYVLGEPLAISHLINNKKSNPRRYDFLFCNQDYHLQNVDYYFDEARDASSDHAYIKASFCCS